MSGKTPTDTFLEGFTRAPPKTTGIRPFKPSTVHFHELKDDIFGLVEFPVKVMLLAFQEVFSKTERWRYDPDVARTNIYIQDRYPQTSTGEVERPALRPAIITDRGPISLANINGRLHNRRVTPQQGENGLVTFTDLVNCPMTVHCLSPRGPEAERIASIVFAMLVIDENIFKMWGVHALTDVAIGTEGPLEETSQLELVNVPVSFHMQYGWAWARRPDGDFIERLGSLDLTAQ